jgi:putative peptide zinc metalloprotease protein
METTCDPSIEEPLNSVLRLRTDLRIERRDLGGEACYVIDDPIRAKIYRVGVPECTFIALLDGTRTIGAAIGESAKCLGELSFSEPEALSICRWLLDSQLVQRVDVAGHQHLTHQVVARPRWWTRLKNPLSIRVPLCNPTACLDRIEPWLAWTLRRPFLLFWFAACTYAIYIVGTSSSDLAAGTSILLDRSHFWLLVASWLCLKLFHETYHAMVCRKYGGSVHEAGIFLLFFAPVPYVDVKSSWRFASKWQRIAVAAAGMYIELLLAAIAIMLWASSTSEAARHVAASVAILGSLGTLIVNANPLMRFDGYFILSDLLEIPNLNAHGRRWLGSLVARILGCRVAPLGLAARQARIVKFYSVAALVWRMMVWLALMIALLLLLGRVHQLLAITIALGVLGGMTYRAGYSVRRFVRSHADISRGRVFAVVGCGLVLAATAAVACFGPATVAAPGVVEYQTLTVVRPATPGFVRELFVHDGETVVAGKPLLRLENQELTVRLRTTELEIEKSIARCRSLRQAGQTAKEQAELAEQTGLRKERDELAAQVESLTVTATASGNVVGRNLEAWLGRYVETGTELLMIGDEDAKEVLVAVPQDDVELFNRRSEGTLTVRFAALGVRALQATEISIEPRATTQPPHEALSSRLDGPLAVRVNDDPLDRGNRAADELLDLCFKAAVPLSPEQSRALFAGQIATVEFRSANESLAKRAANLVWRWLDRAIAQPR